MENIYISGGDAILAGLVELRDANRITEEQLKGCMAMSDIWDSFEERGITPHLEVIETPVGTVFKLKMGILQLTALPNHETIKVSDEAFDKLTEIIEGDGEPNEALKALMARPVRWKDNSSTGVCSGVPKELNMQERLDSILDNNTITRQAVDEFFEKYWINPWLHWSRFYVINSLKHGKVNMPLSKDGSDFLESFLDKTGVATHARATGL